MIRDEIDLFLASQEENSEDSMATPVSEDKEPLDAQHVILGSSLAPVSLRVLEDQNSGDAAFPGLRKKTAASLVAILSAETGRYQRVVLTEEHQVCYTLYFQ